MTASTEVVAFGAADDRATRERWRERMAAEQDAALPQGGATVSCSAPLGAGGLGRHLQEIVDALRRRGQPSTCISGGERGADRRGLALKLLELPLPLGPAVRTRASTSEFDAYAARQLRPAEHLIAFNGQALAQLARAEQIGYRSRTLVSANSHMRRVIRQHEKALRRYPLEGSWASRMLQRNLRELERCDRVLVASRYIHESFLEEGFDEDRLDWFPLTPHPRFDGAREAAPPSDRFEIVYVGSLAVHKGVPLLIDAVRRLPHPEIRLRLLGGWGTRGMRRFVEEACTQDSRIVAGPGDPLPSLATADVCVHAAYEDGFGYAPAEALAAGVPVIVTEDTGMKDLIDSQSAGLVVPTGELDALAQAIEAACRGELFAGR